MNTHKPGILYTIIFILPFLLFHWMIPFVSDRTIGNDYTRFAIDHQMELMFSLKTGSFPLYIPGFAGGQSASALTQGQIFHPMAHLAALMPGYWSGKALEWNTLLRLLSLAAAHLALFIFLRRLKLSLLMALVISTMTTYNLRMLDLFRYGALESWTGFIFLCMAIAWYDLKPTRIRGPLLIIGATYCLVCSGHPQMMYYGMIGAGVFTLITPYFLALMLPEKEVTIRTASAFWSRTGLWITAGILLALVYILPFYFDFITTNAGRVNRSYEWADMYLDTFIGTLNNFFYPLRSDVHTVFAGSSLFLAAALTPILGLFRVKDSQEKIVPPIIWGILGLALVIFLYLQGSRTLLHYLGWKYLPFASSFRVPGRISMILPMLFMLILAWMIYADSLNLKLAGKDIRVSPRTIPAMAGILITVVYACCIAGFTADKPGPGIFSPIGIRKIPPWIEHAILGAGITSLAALVFHGFLAPNRRYETANPNRQPNTKHQTPNTKQPDNQTTKQPNTRQPNTRQPNTKQPNTKQPDNQTTKQPNTKQPNTKQPNTRQPNTKQPDNQTTKIILFLTVCLQITGLLYYGTWTEAREDKPSFEQKLAKKQKKLTYHADLPGFGMGTEAVMRQARRAYIEPFLGKIYRKCLIAGDNEEAYRLMQEGRTPDQVVLELNETSSLLCPDKSGETGDIFQTGADRVELIYSSFNRLIFEARASAPGFFGLAYPYTGHWKATVNGQDTHVYRANGGSHAVRIPAGISQVEFRYRSLAAFRGMLLSCATLAGLGIIFGLRSQRKTLGLGIGLAVVMLSIGGFMVWNRSLYSGDNLGTRFVWTARPPEEPLNLAYSKRTRMSSNIYELHYPYLHTSGKGIDGDRSPGSGFMTRFQPNPWWIADLHHPARISSVLLYESRNDSEYNRRPLSVRLSADQKAWHTISLDKENTSPLHIALEKPFMARYILIQASGYCRLSFDEIEVRGEVSGKD